MEGRGLMRKHTCDENTSAPSSSSSSSVLASVSMHKNSQTISKMKSKIRIIHIFAPEIIKTDAANFRELVQRLTGKPKTDEHQSCCSKREKMDGAAAEYAGFRERVLKEEEEIWRDANTGGGFLGGFLEFDQFPFMEGTTSQN
ncbi:hypothetical protein C2S51_003029 [Perilla frutescens var. frutescens]|nr:hypothetical protein C2S51_003029 [Perilla frutescens var. frutescens]